MGIRIRTSKGDTIMARSRIAKVKLLEGGAAQGFIMRMYNSFDTDINRYGEEEDQKIGYYKSSSFNLWVAFDNRENKLNVKSCKNRNEAITWCVTQRLRNNNGRFI